MDARQPDRRRVFGYGSLYHDSPSVWCYLDIPGQYGVKRLRGVRCAQAVASS